MDDEGIAIGFTGHPGDGDGDAGPRRSSRPAYSSSVTVGGVLVMASTYSSTSRSNRVNASDSRRRGTWLALARSRFLPNTWK
ncbi:hypothetical protein QFZ75_003549 [Streptomyces sp. V3I8]|nr:hypothetical protein [Streptomyces sp. V3I8]